MIRTFFGVIQDLFRYYFFHIGKKIKQPFRRAGGTQAEKSARFGQNGLYKLADKSYMPGFRNCFFAILGWVGLTKTIFQGISLGY